MSTNGSGLVRASTHYYISNIMWSGDSNYLVWMGGVAMKGYASDVFLYSVNNATITQVSAGGVVGEITMNPAKTALV